MYKVQHVKDLTILAAAIGAAIGTIVLLLILAWITGLLVWNGYNRLRLWQVRGGRYAIKQVEDPPGIVGVGQAVRSRIVDELSFAGRSARTLQNVDSPDAAVPTQVPVLPEPIKGLGPLVNLLLHQDRFVITVTALPVLSDKAKLHVLLSRSTGKVLESRRFTEPIGNREDILEAYTGTAMQAGAWLAFMLDKYVRSRLPRNGNRRVELLGTHSWLSYAWLCRGLRHAQSEKEQIAWYNAALRVDHRNIGALIALGKRLTASEESIHFGIRHLQWAREQLSGNRDSGPNREGMSRVLRIEHPGTHADPQWFQATFALAVALLHRHDHRSPHRIEQGCLTEAVEVGTELAQAIGATQLTLKSWWRRLALRRRRRVELRRILVREDTTLASVVASSKAALEMHDEGKLLAIEPDWQPSRKRELWKRLNKLDLKDLDSLPSAESLLNSQLCSDNCNDEECHLSETTRYNRACFYVRGEKYEKALAQLKLVFAHMSFEPDRDDSEFSHWLLRWAAKDDPALAPLRANCKSEFEELIERANAAAQGIDFKYPIIT